MNHMQTGIITLLKSAVTGETYALPGDFSLAEALPFIKRQHILCAAYAGAVQCAIPASEPLMQQLYQQYCRQMMLCERQMQAIGAIYRAFDAAGIDYLPLKGCNARALYPKPELRWMSDADILIRADMYERIRPVMQELGFEEQKETDQDISWHSAALHVELHKRLISNLHADYSTYFGDGWQRAKPACGVRYGMDPEDDFIFQFVHFAKHYRNGGIGCRYVLDLWVYRRAHPQMDDAYIISELSKTGLAEFYRNIIHLTQVWFEGSPADEKTDFITDVIFGGGSWGTAQNHDMYQGARLLRPDERARRGRLRLIWISAFPPAEFIQYRYPILKKHPRLLPLIWPRRWVEVLLFRRQNLRVRRRTIQTVTGDGIEAYRQSLAYVGLVINGDRSDD